jgi:hypothetical protein
LRIARRLEVAGDRSLPLLDLFRMDKFQPWTDAMNKEYFIVYQNPPNGDGVHPSSKGHFEMVKLIYHLIVWNCR